MNAQRVDIENVAVFIEREKDELSPPRWDLSDQGTATHLVLTIRLLGEVAHSASAVADVNLGKKLARLADDGILHESISQFVRYDVGLGDESNLYKQISHLRTMVTNAVVDDLAVRVPNAVVKGRVVQKIYKPMEADIMRGGEVLHDEFEHEESHHKHHHHGHMHRLLKHTVSARKRRERELNERHEDGDVSDQEHRHHEEQKHEEKRLRELCSHIKCHKSGCVHGSYSLVLKFPGTTSELPKGHKSGDMEFPDFVKHTIEKLFRSGLQVKLVERTLTSQHKVVLLVRCPEKLFRSLFHRLSVRKYKNGLGEGLTIVGDQEQGGWTDNTGDHNAPRPLLEPTEADRILVTAEILSWPVERGGIGLGNLEHLEEEPHHDPRIVAVFPLHNRDWRTYEVGPTCRCGGGKNEKGCCVGIATAFHQLRATMNVLPGKVSHHTLDYAKDSEDQFLDEIQCQYGERLAYFFAFVQSCKSSMAKFALLYLVLTLFFWISGTSFAWKMRVEGFLGLLIPCMFGPFCVGRWDIEALRLTSRWAASDIGAPMKNPFYEPVDKALLKPLFGQLAQKYLGLKVRRKQLYDGVWAIWSIFLVSAAVFILFVLSILVMECETLVQITPICGSWFHETVWKDYVAYGGNGGNKHPYFNFLARPSCYPGWSEDPLEFMSGGNALRGLYMVLVGLAEGIFVGVLFTEVFTCLAEYLALARNPKLWQEYESHRINYTYPFEAGATIFYYFVLAFIFIPFNADLQGSLAANRNPLILDFNKSSVPLSAPGPCKTAGDNVCDEWRGTCRPGSDKDDCSGYGCMDVNATNYDINATRPVWTMGLAPHSLGGMVVPAQLVCRYHVAGNVSGTPPGPAIGNGSRVPASTVCPTTADGICDEPLACMIQASLEPPRRVTSLYEVCVDTFMKKLQLVTASSISTKGGNANGAKCVFPYQYRGKKYTACTTDDADSKNMPWCATTSNFDADGKWGDCVSGHNACPIGSDAVDCRSQATTFLHSCANSSGCMALLQTHHFNPGPPFTPVDACKSIAGNDSTLMHLTVCNRFPNAWPIAENSTLTAAEEQLIALQEAQRLCGTAVALECIHKCDECASCLTGSGRISRVRTLGNSDGKQTPFCTEYDLCVQCKRSCQPYGHCFSNAVKSRASKGTACQRMGRTNNDWCDEQESTRCTQPSGTSAWSCASGEDAADCANNGTVCNFGCRTQCTDDCEAKFGKASTDACACAIGCKLNYATIWNPAEALDALDEKHCVKVCSNNKSIETDAFYPSSCCHADTGQSSQGLHGTSHSRGGGCCDEPDGCKDPCLVGCNAPVAVESRKKFRKPIDRACGDRKQMITKSSTAVKLYMRDKRFKNQIGPFVRKHNTSPVVA